MAMSEDPRIVAAANIDGTPYGDLPDRQLTRPFLLLQSDNAETHHGDRFINGNGKLLARMTARRPTFSRRSSRARSSACPPTWPRQPLVIPTCWAGP
jgi:predicted dienelactone hydrolase